MVEHTGWHRNHHERHTMREEYEWMPVIHNTCGGQGCGECGHSGELTVYVNVTDYAEGAA